MQKDQEDAIRAEMTKLLGDGLKTQTEPFPENDSEFGQLLRELRDLDPDDLVGKLVLSGWIDKPYGPDNMRCKECIYYLVDRRWCDIPELALPAEPDWWCRLWRI
jgi:hypothetical protein